MDTVVIRQSRKKNVGMVVVTGMFILYYFVGPYEYTRSLFAESPYFTCFLGVVFFGLFLYYLKQFIMQPAEIILSNEGIEIKNKGWNNWNYVSSFWTVAKRDSENYSETEILVIKLKDNTELKCIITELDKDRQEIIALIREFSSNIIYTGHEID